MLLITGAVTHNMAIAAKKTYDAMPSPKFVVAVGDDACDGGIFRDTYAVLGGVDRLLPVDLKIPGNPPTPAQDPRRAACTDEEDGRETGSEVSSLLIGNGLRLFW